MISKNLMNQLVLLKHLSNSPEKVRTAIIEDSDFLLIAAIIEIVQNLCMGYIDTTDKERKEIQKYQGQLEQIASIKKLSKKCPKAKKIINQKGGKVVKLILEPALHTINDIINSNKF